MKISRQLKRQLAKIAAATVMTVSVISPSGVSAFTYEPTSNLAYREVSDSVNSVTDKYAPVYYNTKNYSESDPLFAATHFHIFAYSDVKLNAHTNGNIATNYMSIAGSNSGTSGLNTELRISEVSYVKDFISINPQILWNGNSPLVVGADVKVDTYDNGNGFTLQGSKMERAENMNNSCVKNVFQETKGGASYIDLDGEFVKLRKLSKGISKLEATEDSSIIDFTDFNNRKIKLNMAKPYMIFDVSPSDLSGNTPITLVDYNENGPESVIINVDLKDYSAGNFDENAHIKYITVGGESVANKERTSWEYGKVLWNFYDSSAANGCYSGTIKVNGNFLGSILAPDANVITNQNFDGTAICNTFENHAETHRNDFIGNIPAIALDDDGDTKTTEATTLVSTEATTVADKETVTSTEATTEATTEVTTVSTTEATTVATTEVTTVATTEATTVATTEATTKATTVATTTETTTSIDDDDSGRKTTAETTTEATTVATTAETTTSSIDDDDNDKKTTETTTEVTSVDETESTTNADVEEDSSETTSVEESGESSESTSEDTEDTESSETTTDEDESESTTEEEDTTVEDTTTSGSAIDDETKTTSGTTTETTTESTTETTTKSVGADDDDNDNKTTETSTQNVDVTENSTEATTENATETTTNKGGSSSSDSDRPGGGGSAGDSDTEATTVDGDSSSQTTTNADGSDVTTEATTTAGDVATETTTTAGDSSSNRHGGGSSSDKASVKPNDVDYENDPSEDVTEAGDVTDTNDDTQDTSDDNTNDVENTSDFNSEEETEAATNDNQTDDVTSVGGAVADNNDNTGNNSSASDVNVVSSTNADGSVDKLPQTGSVINTMALLAIGCGAVAFGMLLLIKSKKKA